MHISLRIAPCGLLRCRFSPPSPCLGLELVIPEEFFIQTRLDQIFDESQCPYLYLLHSVSKQLRATRWMQVIVGPDGETLYAAPERPANQPTAAPMQMGAPCSKCDKLKALPV